MSLLPELHGRPHHAGDDHEDRAELLRRFGIDDHWPVVCEPFTQWVLEDRFEARPPFEEAGVQLVDDVDDFTQ
jgi:mannitol 2-dehydrogenase